MEPGLCLLSRFIGQPKAEKASNQEEVCWKILAIAKNKRV